MKTKVAEALMHGKPVIGTSEAFVGNKEVADEAGWRCDTVTAFIAAIGEVEQEALPAFDPALRSIFDRFYSFEAAKNGLRRIVG